MKNLKSKIAQELEVIEANAGTMEELDYGTLELAYKLAKTMYYLCKMDKSADVPVSENRTSRML